MGQAKQRGSKEKRIAEAMARESALRANQTTQSMTSMMQMASVAKRLDPLFEILTTPAAINEQVTQFAQKIGGNAPIFLECQPEPWSRQSCCDMNVEKFIEANGGRMLCGYRIWCAEPRYIEGERHAVWTDNDAIRDVSFVDSGESIIVFVPDEKSFTDAPGKVRLAFNEADKEALKAYEQLEGLMTVTRMPDKEAWSTYPTYEEWSQGRRMPNFIPALSQTYVGKTQP